MITHVLYIAIDGIYCALQLPPPPPLYKSRALIGWLRGQIEQPLFSEYYHFTIYSPPQSRSRRPLSKSLQEEIPLRLIELPHLVITLCAMGCHGDRELSRSPIGWLLHSRMLQPSPTYRNPRIVLMIAPHSQLSWIYTHDLVMLWELWTRGEQCSFFTIFFFFFNLFFFISKLLLPARHCTNSSAENKRTSEKSILQKQESELNFIRRE